MVNLVEHLDHLGEGARNGKHIVRHGDAEGGRVEDFTVGQQQSQFGGV